MAKGEPGMWGKGARLMGAVLIFMALVCPALPAPAAEEGAPAKAAAKGKEKAQDKKAPATADPKAAGKPGEAPPDKAAEALKKLEDISGKPPTAGSDEGLAGLDAKTDGDNPAAPPGPVPQFDPRIVQLIEQKRAELAVEETRLARERQELEKLRQEVGGRIEDLKKVQTVLEDLVKTEQNQRAERVQQLVKVLANMKADAAGAVVAKLDDQMAVDVFSKMPPRTSGKVMATLKPEQAARIGELLTRTQQAREAAKMAAAAATAGTQPPPKQ